MIRVVALLATLCLTSNLWGMGEERIGNKPLNAANYEAWPGVMPVINDKHRVYSWWVNGNEKFFFRGDTIALNDALQRFSNIKADKLEVVLRPGPASAKTFQGNREFPYHWHLHLIGGIAGHLAKRDLGENVWAPHPIMYVYVGNEIQLSDLQIPDSLQVLQLADLKRRYAKSLSSDNQSVRGWTCGELAALDPHDATTLAQVKGLLSDDVAWVRLNAVGAIANYGHLAKSLISDIRSARMPGEDQLDDRIDQAIDSIASDTADSPAMNRHTKMLAAIAAYCDSRNEDDAQP